MGEIKRRFETVLDLGGHDGYVARKVQALPGVDRVICCDLSGSMLALAQGERIVVDEEYLPFKHGYFSLILSNLSLHWVNDLPGSLGTDSSKSEGGWIFSRQRVWRADASVNSEKRSAKPKRLAAKTRLPESLPLMDIRDGGSLLQRSGFSLPAVVTETLTVHFDSAYDLLRDLRGMGESNALLSRSQASKTLFKDVMRQYHERFQTEEGKVFASFEILYLSGWAPDPSPPSGFTARKRENVFERRLKGTMKFIEQSFDIDGIEIFTQRSGVGPPLLLLHGYPQNHLAWGAAARRLAQDFTVVIADLRGYGKSSKPPGDPDHQTYSKRAMARDQVDMMRRLSFEQFFIAGHDRGGRVGHRMALDYPEVVLKLAVLDIVPTLTMAEKMTCSLALSYYHWFFLSQPDGLPERLIGGDPEYYLRHRGYRLFERVRDVLGVCTIFFATLR